MTEIQPKLEFYPISTRDEVMYLIKKIEKQVESESDPLADKSLIGGPREWDESPFVGMKESTVLVRTTAYLELFREKRLNR